MPVEYIASGPSAAHSVICTKDGRCWTFGRNDNGQLGHGDGGWPLQIRVLAAPAGAAVLLPVLALCLSLSRAEGGAAK